MVKTPVVIQPAYTIYFEAYEGLTWTHADVRQWTPTIAKEFYNVHGILNVIHGQPFYCLVDNSKLEKFVKQLGYKFVKEAHCVDDITRSIYRYG